MGDVFDELVILKELATTTTRWYNSLSKEHQDSVSKTIRGYSYNSSVNVVLRTKNYMDESIKLLMDLAPALEHDLVVYRGTHDELDDEWFEKGIMSVTPIIKYAQIYVTGKKGSILRMTIPRGTKYILKNIFDTSPDDLEIIIMPYQLHCSIDKTQRAIYNTVFLWHDNHIGIWEKILHKPVVQIPIYDVKLTLGIPNVSHLDVLPGTFADNPGQFEYEHNIYLTEADLDYTWTHTKR